MDISELKDRYSSMINYNSENEDNWTILSRIILENPEFVKSALRTARDELYHFTYNRNGIDKKEIEECSKAEGAEAEP